MKYDIVETIKDHPELKIKSGDRFVAEVYAIDSEKYILLERLGDGFKPECTEYLYNLKKIKL